MIRDVGVLIRSIPYSDSARILHCFTENHGLLALFARKSKSLPHAHLRPGSLIEFTAQDRAGTGLVTLKEARWNPLVPTDPLFGEAASLWTFAVELLQKSLRENLILPQLYHRLVMYYAQLTQANISLNPAVPLIVISSELGLSDLPVVEQLGGSEIQIALNALGISCIMNPTNEGTQTNVLFRLELDRFQEHFGITTLLSLDLLE